MTHIPLASRWTALARQTADAMGANIDEGFVSEPEILARALADAAALGAMLAGAIGRGLAVDKDTLLAAEALLRAVLAAQPALVAREVDRVLMSLDGQDPGDDVLAPDHLFRATNAIEAALSIAYPRYFESRTAA